MFNSTDSFHSGTYFDLRKRVIQRLQLAKVDDLIFEAMKAVYEKALMSENIVLSRPERDRLLHEVLKAELVDMLAKLDGAK